MITFRNELKNAEEVSEGATIPNVSYFKFRIEMVYTITIPELSDEEILMLAQRHGQFDFLEEPEEDIYDLSDGTPL